MCQTWIANIEDCPVLSWLVHVTCRLRIVRFMPKSLLLHNQNHGRPQAGAGGTCPWKCCKVFCALAVTVKTCVLRATTKKGRHIFWGKKCTPMIRMRRNFSFIYCSSVVNRGLILYAHFARAAASNLTSFMHAAQTTHKVKTRHIGVARGCTGCTCTPVSYTHLTLPTNREV